MGSGAPIHRLLDTVLMARTIGFVGLGTIGRPLVDNLLASGERTVVYDLDADAVVAVVAQGAHAAGSLAELAASSSLVGVCVPADEHVRAVLDGPEGLFAHLGRGSVVAIHSTVLPETVQWAAAEGRARGIGVVEAPVTGGAAAASAGRSTFLLAGEPEHVEAIEPILAACGEARVAAGQLGDANRLKLCINLQTCVTFLGVYEAASLAKRLGVPLAGLKAAMRANGQLGEMTGSYFVMQELPPDAFADPGLRATLERNAAIVAKDLGLIAEVARDVGIDLPAARLAAEEVSTFFFLDQVEARR